MASHGPRRMTRPIVWALGVFASVSIAASVAGERLAKLRPAGPPPRAVAIEPTTFGSDGRLLVVDGDRSGHFRVSVTIDGSHLFMLVDTGASSVALSAEDAAAAGIRPAPKDFSRLVSTANGTIAVAPVQLREMRVGDLLLRDVDAVVIPKGRLGTSLLGMSFLGRLRGFEIAGNRLTLKG